jgi:outer membrane protein OmpA-like peptidoglycan-associated protein
MYKNPTLRIFWIIALVIISFSCSPKRRFHRGAAAYIGKNDAKAAKIANEFKDHSIYGPGAQLILLDLKYRKTRQLPQLFEANTAYTDLLKVYETLPKDQLLRLKAEKLGKGKVQSKQAGIQRKVITIARKSESVKILDTVATRAPVMQKRVKESWKAARAEVVNKNVRTKSYDIATSIINNHLDVVEKKNWRQIWVLRDSIWKFFKRDYTLCDIDKFRKDHPWHYKSSDCWHQQAKEVFCSGSIEKAIEFEENYPYSAFDFDILYYMLELADKGNIQELSTEKQAMFKLVRRYVNLLLVANSCRQVDANLYRDLQEIVPKMAPRLFAYTLLMDATSYLFHQNEDKKAIDLLRLCQPYFPDTSVCFLADYEFQVNKQPRIDSCLTCAGQPSLNYMPFDAANTPRFMEYGAISWDEGNEVYFARRLAKGKVLIMRTTREPTGWSVPVEDYTLSVNNVASPMSLTADGLQMLLKVEQSLYIAQRYGESAPWNAPVKLPLKIKGLRRAVFAPDGKALIIEASYGKTTLNSKASSDLYYSLLEEDGSFSKPRSLGAQINTNEKEGNPFLCTDGKTLYFSSEGHGTFGDTDIFVSKRKGTAWDEWTLPHNLGCKVNSGDNDYAFTWIPETGKKAFYTFKNPCSRDLNIFSSDLPEFARPTPLTHLRGQILSSRGKPITRGEIELNINDGQTIVRIPISAKGQYHYKIPPNTFKIRIYPDVAGYYTTRDTSYRFQNIPVGTNLRDTFVLLNRLEVEKKFQIKYATFDAKNNLNDPRVIRELEFLYRFAQRIKAKFEIQVHTDAKGSMQLAQTRADTIHQALITRFGMPAGRATAKGIGSAAPRCPGNDPVANACNNRVEVRFTYPPTVEKDIKTQTVEEQKKQTTITTTIVYKKTKDTDKDDLDVIEDATEEGENRKSKRPKTWVGRVWRKITFKDRREAKKERPKKGEVEGDEAADD